MSAALEDVGAPAEEITAEQRAPAILNGQARNDASAGCSH